MIEIIQKLAPAPPTGLYSHGVPLMAQREPMIGFELTKDKHTSTPIRRQTLLLLLTLYVFTWLLILKYANVHLCCH